MAVYYGQRSTKCGLLITEATTIADTAHSSNYGLTSTVRCGLEEGSGSPTFSRGLESLRSTHEPMLGFAFDSQDPIQGLRA
ncbi:hypothetical protein CRG98_040628 [Punica granatum]|uniref:Uncharacterized protein n=1 Tax=Punica granatum TaxID=22663 RepID=A0A2I0I6D5_PUNGR|nr:hypothetical protein CRG98_040628 [Punica granatum]